MGQKSAEIAESCESWRDNRVQGIPLLAGPALDGKPGVGVASILSNRLAWTCPLNGQIEKWIRSFRGQDRFRDTIVNPD
jgi:hypothetical protein